jgi:uncharacterized protein YukE
MSNIIHMETDEVRMAAEKLDRTSIDIYQMILNLGNSIRSLNWQGGGRDEFVSEFGQLEKRFADLSQLGTILSGRIKREADEWIAVDGAGAQNFSNIITTVGVYTVPIGMLFQDALWSLQYGDFKSWWSKLSQVDKIAYLRYQYQKIARQNGLTPVEFKVEDLPDSKGVDQRGVYREDEIVIDIDNLQSDNPWRLIETMAHETRHQFQKQTVERYASTGQVPEGCTEEQVKAWAENAGNYRDGNNDFEAYWTQPLEQDAREYGSTYMKEVFENKDWGSLPASDPVNNSTYASNSTNANVASAVT